jgi:hypothetical protein
MFGLLSSPLGFTPPPRAFAEVVSPEAPYPFTHVDDVLINGLGYDVGGDGFANGSPVESAKVIWTAAWYGPIPDLTGKIHFDGAERCARIVLISYDESGAELSPRDYSDVECPSNLAHQTDEITEGGTSGLNGRVGAASVKVQLQTQNTNQTWSNAGSRTVTYGPVLDTDQVEIYRSRVDLGSGDLVDGTPSAPATLEWKSEGGPISANLRGTLFVNDSIDLCFRMHVGYKKHDGTLLEDPRHGDENCATTDGLHRFPINMGGAFEHNELAEVTYAIEQKGGTGVWESLGATTLELGDGRVILDTDIEPEFP